MFSTKIASASTFFHISFSANLCVFGKYPSLQLLQKKFVFIISLVFFFIWKFLFEKNLLRKNCCLEQISFETIVFLIKKLLSSPLDCCSIFFEEKTLRYFSFVLLFFAFVVFFSFYFFLFFFRCLSSFLRFSKQKITFKTKSLEKYKFSKTCFFWTFLGGRKHILIQKNLSKNYHLNFLQKKKPLIWRKENKFQDSHALRIACAIERSVDHCGVSWRGWPSQVFCAFSCHWSGLFWFFSVFIIIFFLFLLFFIFCVPPFFGVVFTLSPRVFAVSTSSCTFCKLCFCFVSDFCHFFIFSVGLGLFERDQMAGCGRERITEENKTKRTLWNGCPKMNGQSHQSVENLYRDTEQNHLGINTSQ